MRMKKNKKGVTLVELVICCAIIVMLGGACTAVLASGSTLFNHSSRTAGVQLDSDVLQTYMISFLPSAEDVNEISPAAAASSNGVTIYLNDNGEFTIRSNGSDTTIRSVTKFSYKVARAGDSTSTTAKAQFQYTVEFNDDSIYSGGFMMINYPYVSTTAVEGCLDPNTENTVALEFLYPAAASEET